MCRLPRLAGGRLQMKNLTQRSGIDLPIGTKLHERFHVLGPLVVNFGTPQLVPAVLVVNLGVQKKLQIVRESCDLSDAAGFNFPDEFRPDVIVVMLVLGESSWFQAQRKRTANHPGFLYSVG